MKKPTITTGAALISIALALGAPFLAQAQAVPAYVSASSSSPFCYTFTANLGLNSYMTPAEANALEQVLVAQGLWNQASTITSYNREVSIAVSAFQEKYASQILTPNGLSRPTGYFGPSTRTELNLLYGCSGVPVSSYPSSSPSSQSFNCPAGWTCTPPATTTQPDLSVNPNSFFTLASPPTISVENVTPGGASTTVLEYRATFNVTIHAAVGNLTLGLPNSATPAFSVNPNSVGIYKDGVLDSLSNYQPVVSYSQPSGTTLSADGTAFTVGQNQTVTVPVTYTFIVTGGTADTYAVQLQGVYSSLGLIDSMLNQPGWRTASM